MLLRHLWWCCLLLPWCRPLPRRLLRWLLLRLLLAGVHRPKLRQRLLQPRLRLRLRHGCGAPL
jgi:hypothetical protein